MNLLYRLLLNTLAIIIVAYLLPGVSVSGFWIALVVAIVLGIINTFIKPILFILTLPLTILSLGLFYLVLNAVLIQLTSAIIDGFNIKNFWWAILFSLVLALVNAVFHSFSNKPEHRKTTYLH
jgi:putative membrane protein